MPFGQIRQELGGARVLAIPSRGPAFLDQLPAPRLEVAGASVEVEASLDAAGRIEGQVVFRIEGPESAREREHLAMLDSAGRFNMLQEKLADMFPGAILSSADFPAAEDPSKPYTAVARFELPGALSPATGGRQLCPTGLEPLGLVSDLAMDASRQHPLKLAAPRFARESVSLRLPPGTEVASLPEAAVTTSTFGSYSLTAARTADGFRLERRALLAPQTVAPADYPAFREFCQSVDDAEKARVLLRPRSRP
jgi:hypothetical protein